MPYREWTIIVLLLAALLISLCEPVSRGQRICAAPRRPPAS